MTLTLQHCIALLLVPTCSLAQNTAQSLQFEVASVKPVMPGSQVRSSMQGGPASPQINYVAVTLRNLILLAYNLDGYQLSGPDWQNEDRFTVRANVPAGCHEITSA